MQENLTLTCGDNIRGNDMDFISGWVKDRLPERTTWDGGVCVALGLLVLFMAPLAKIVAGVAIAYGVWTIWKGE